MGSVWRAEDLQLKAPAAVKLMVGSIVASEEARARFRREARAAAAIRSQHVVQVIQYGIEGDIPFIAMELLEGESLEERIRRVGRLAPAETVQILSQVCQGLSRAHEERIVHRDLKPGNIFLVREGSNVIVKLVDFGIAKRLGELGDSHGIRTSTGAIMGTPFYMSPEQAAGEPVDHRTDIWSLGVVAFECLIGKRPFEGGDLDSLLKAICQDSLPIPSQWGQVPDRFDAWFARTVTRSTEERFGSASDAATELRRILDPPDEHWLPTHGLILGGRFRLVERLGGGSMGSVWRTDDLQLKAPAAVKLISESIGTSKDAESRFRREAQAAAAIRSQYVVGILGYGVEGSIPFIAMELLDGESLEERLKRLGRLTPTETVQILSHVCQALARTHEAGIVHRDLKPANIFLVREGSEVIAKLIDFGIAKRVAEFGESSGQQSQEGVVLGTPYYMSPEQAAGERVDHRSDIWSLGVIAFECLIGRRPFEAPTWAGLVQALCVDPLPIPSHLGVVPARFDAWFARAVARATAKRFDSASDAANELRAILDPRKAREFRQLFGPAVVLMALIFITGASVLRWWPGVRPLSAADPILAPTSTGGGVLTSEAFHAAPAVGSPVEPITSQPPVGPVVATAAAKGRIAPTAASRPKSALVVAPAKPGSSTPTSEPTTMTTTSGSQTSIPASAATNATVGAKSTGLEYRDSHGFVRLRSTSQSDGGPQ